MANAFASHFNKVYLNATGDRDSDYLSFMFVIKEHDSNATNISNDITVELVDKCMLVKLLDLMTYPVSILNMHTL